MSLAWVEGRRLLWHPIALVGFGLSVIALTVARSADPGQSFVDLTGGGSPGLWLPPAVFFAANLCASRSRRSGTDEMYAAAPMGRDARTAAQCAAGLFPATAALVLVVFAAVYLTLTGVGVTPEPTPAELLLLPLSVAGAAALGVMVARWLPWRGAVMVVFVALVAISVGVNSGVSPWWLSYVYLADFHDEKLTIFRVAGSSLWHAVYLVGLVTMAVIGALLRDSSHRARLLCVGAAVTLLTASAGWAQLP